MDFTTARIEVEKLRRMEAKAGSELRSAIYAMIQSLPGFSGRPRQLKPEVFRRIVAAFSAQVAGNPFLLGIDAKPIAPKSEGHLKLRRLHRIGLLLPGRTVESSHIVLETTASVHRRRWHVDQEITPIVVSRHALYRYLVRCGRDLGQLRNSLDAALVLIKAWLSTAGGRPELAPLSFAVPIESGALLGTPHMFTPCEEWCHRVECSRGELRKVVTDARRMLGLSIRTFIHEDMFTDLQEQKLATVKDISAEIVATLREEASTDRCGSIAGLLNDLFATTSDAAWQRAFRAQTTQLTDAVLTFEI